MEAVLVLIETFVIYLSNSAASLRSISLDATVEAEFGDDCVEGHLATLAHHGDRGHNPPPCDDPGVPTLPKGSTVGISHIDLDTVGGLLRLAGYVPQGLERAFWALAGLLDVRGFHRMRECAHAVESNLWAQESPLVPYMGLVKDWIYAYHAWAQANRVFPPRDGSAENVVGQVIETAKILSRIFACDEGLLADGLKFAKDESALNGASFVDVYSGKHKVMVRHSSEGFTNHLYTSPDGLVCDVVVALRDDFENITVSRADDDVPLDCCNIVQALWGPKAGGHPYIAGSPRGKKMNRADLDDVRLAVVKALIDASDE